MRTSKLFYNNIKSTSGLFTDFFVDTRNFHRIPEDWLLVVADIIDSGKHYKKYKQMTIVTSSVITVCLNVAKKHKIKLPYIYGGDGAFIAIPPVLLSEISSELAVLYNNSIKFGIDTRIGIIGIRELFEKHDAVISVGKFMVHGEYEQAVFYGAGVAVAERLIKSSMQWALPQTKSTKGLNLSGLQCRFEPLPNLQPNRKVMCLIIEPNDKRSFRKVLGNAMHDIDEVYGTFNYRHPIGTGRYMRPVGAKTLMYASLLKYGNIKPIYVITSFIKAVIHLISLRLNLGLTFFRHDDYTKELILATDTLKIDTSLKTILSGTKRQHKRLLRKLKRREEDNELKFGEFITDRAVVNCYIHQKGKEYINLIDGDQGGYARAARILKNKYKKTDK